MTKTKTAAIIAAITLAAIVVSMAARHPSCSQPEPEPEPKPEPSAP